MNNQIENAFTYHSPKGDRPRRYEEIRNEAKKLALTIDGLCPDCREKDLATTKLEEVVMWANAAIARN